VFFPQWFQAVDDPRDAKKITFSLPALAFTAILMFVCRLRSRRQVGFWLRTAEGAAKLAVLFGAPRVPHGDTINQVCQRVAADQVQEVVTGFTETLIRDKALYPYRLFDQYYVVAIDGVETLTFDHRHCDQCLTRTRNGHTTYYHPVLEAKIVTPNGFACSLLTEFIENPAPHPTKQDCELKAFYRLAARLKKRLPRLPLLLALDGLFASGPTFGICRQNNWRFMITLKDGDLPSVHEEFKSLIRLQPENRLIWHTGPDGRTSQVFRWVEDIAYRDTAGHDHRLNVLECRETKINSAGEANTTTYKWVTDCAITPKNVAGLANQGGRIRWKIENEGFNCQKNGGYELEHAYSENENAAKVFYFLMQIAHLLAQLMEKGNLLGHAWSRTIGSVFNLGRLLLEAWRNLPLTAENIAVWLNQRIQIRFDSS
jgi:hypothetical protein